MVDQCIKDDYIPKQVILLDAKKIMTPDDDIILLHLGIIRNGIVYLQRYVRLGWFEDVDEVVFQFKHGHINPTKELIDKHNNALEKLLDVNNYEVSSGLYNSIMDSIICTRNLFDNQEDSENAGKSI